MPHYLSKSISNMLQYNVPPKEIARLLRNQQFEPSGFVSRHPYIRSASSIADLLSKILEIELGDFSRCQIKPDNFKPICEESVENKNIVKIDKQADSSDNLNNTVGERIYGEVCPECSSTQLYRNGTCKVCKDCGATTGCS